MQHAQDEKHAERVAIEVAQTSLTTPKPAELRKIMQHLRDDTGPPTQVCPHCNGTGWISKQRKGVSKVFPDEVYWFAAPCNCRRPPPAQETTE